MKTSINPSTDAETLNDLRADMNSVKKLWDGHEGRHVEIPDTRRRVAALKDYLRLRLGPPAPMRTSL